MKTSLLAFRWIVGASHTDNRVLTRAWLAIIILLAALAYGFVWCVLVRRDYMQAVGALAAGVLVYELVMPDPEAMAHEAQRRGTGKRD